MLCGEESSHRSLENSSLACVPEIVTTKDRVLKDIGPDSGRRHSMRASIIYGLHVSRFSERSLILKKNSTRLSGKFKHTYVSVVKLLKTDAYNLTQLCKHGVQRPLTYQARIRDNEHQSKIG